MNIELQRVSVDEAPELHRLQVQGFAALLAKYQDFDTNPGAETVERVRERFEYSDWVDQYWIQLGTEKIGYIRIQRKENNVYRLSQMFILPAFQGQGYAQQTIRQAEEKHPQARTWELDTIKQEPKLRHLYEKMGYRLASSEHCIRDGMDLVDYVKP